MIFSALFPRSARMSAPGYCLPDLLASMVVLGIVTSACVKLTMNCSQTLVNAQHEDRRTAILLKSEILAGDSARAYDTSAWNIGLRVHKHAKIRFSDGALNPVMQGNQTLRPKSGTDALTSAALVTKHSILLVNSSRHGSRLRATACPRWQPLVATPAYKSFLGLLPDGFIELIADQRISSLQQCRTLSFSFNRSMIAGTSSPEALLSIRALVPISHIHTLYVDRRGQLRLISHQGQRNIENQPLLEGLDKFTVKQWRASLHPLSGISLLIGTSPREAVNVSFASRLSRVPSFNFLLNRP